MNSRTRKLIVTVLVSAFLIGCAAFSWGAWWAFSGRYTRTRDPSSEEIAYAREYCYIHPDLEIEPLGYCEKRGMDYQVRFKFIAHTDDPASVLDPTHVDPPEFRTDFVHPPGEPDHNEHWWDVHSRDLTGETFWAPKNYRKFWRLSLGYAENDDGTLTVYAWRFESGVPDSDRQDE